MPRQALQPDGVAAPKPPFSPVVVSGDLVYTAGQVAHDAEARSSRAASRSRPGRRSRTSARASRLAVARSTTCMKVTAFLADLGDFDGYNRVYREFFAEPYPARTSVQAGCRPACSSRSRHCPQDA